MSMLKLDDAVEIALYLLSTTELGDMREEEFLAEYGDYVRGEFEQKCWICNHEEITPLKRLHDLILDIHPDEIASKIESGTLHRWCEKVQVEMQMCMVELPYQKKGEWIPIEKGEHGYSAGDFRCSICGKPNHCYCITNFCSKCGADMRG